MIDKVRIFWKKCKPAHQVAPVVPGADVAAAKFAGIDELQAFLEDDGSQDRAVHH